MRKSQILLILLSCIWVAGCLSSGLVMRKREKVPTECSVNHNFKEFSINTIAVLPFVPTKKTETGDYTPMYASRQHQPIPKYIHLQNDQEVLPGILEKSLIDSGRFRVAERRKLRNITKEMELQQAGLIDEKTLAKVGKLTGADAVVTGTNIIALAAFQWQSYGDTVIGAYIGYITSELRMTHVETGRVIWVCKIQRDSLNYVKNDISISDGADINKTQEYGGPGEINAVLFVAEKAFKEAVATLQ